jgi:hypothetical protein
MKHEIPGTQVPDTDDPREKNGTGEQADEAQLGVTDEEVKDLANDAEGG